MRQALLLSLIWVGLIVVVLWSFVGDVKFNECTSLPGYYEWQCNDWRKQNAEDGFFEPAYNHPRLQDFPNLVDDNGWKPLGDGFHHKPGPLKLPGLDLTLTLREGERAALKPDLRWMRRQLLHRCREWEPEAMIYAREGARLKDVTFVYYRVENRDTAKFIYGDDVEYYSGVFWDDINDINKDAFEAELSRQNDLSRYDRNGDWPTVDRYAHIEMLDYPQSLGEETGVPFSFTYARRVTAMNSNEEPELHATIRTIVFPVGRGRITMDSVITSFDDDRPEPASWQHVWRNAQTSHLVPEWPPRDAVPGATYRSPTLDGHMGTLVECNSLDRIPPRWAWPKLQSRYW